MEIGEAGCGGGESFFFFAKGEAHLGAAVASIIVEAGARDTGNANLFDQVARKAEVGRFGGGAVRRGELQERGIGHDVVGTSRIVNGEAGVLQDVEEARALYGIGGGKLVVIVLRKLQGEGARMLQGSRGANGEEIVNFAYGLRGFGRSEGPADAPTGDAVCFGHTVDDDGAIAHAVDAGHRDVLVAVINDVLVDFVGDAESVPTDAEIADEF